MYIIDALFIYQIQSIHHLLGILLGLRATTGEGNGNPLQYSCLENPRDREAWWAAVYGVAQSQTRLTRLSSGSSRATTVCKADVIPALNVFYKFCQRNSH